MRHALQWGMMGNRFTQSSKRGSLQFEGGLFVWFWRLHWFWYWRMYWFWYWRMYWFWCWRLYWYWYWSPHSAVKHLQPSFKQFIAMLRMNGENKKIHNYLCEYVTPWGCDCFQKVHRLACAEVEVLSHFLSVSAWHPDRYVYIYVLQFVNNLTCRRLLHQTHCMCTCLFSFFTCLIAFFISCIHTNTIHDHSWSRTLWFCFSDLYAEICFSIGVLRGRPRRSGKRGTTGILWCFSEQYGIFTYNEDIIRWNWDGMQQRLEQGGS